MIVGWLWLLLELIGASTLLWIVIDILAGKQFGSERLTGRHFTEAESKRTETIGTRARWHGPLALIAIIIVAAHLRQTPQTMARVAPLLGCLAFVIVECGFRSVYANQYWWSGHLRAAEAYKSSIRTVLKPLPAGLAVAVAVILFPEIAQFPPIAALVQHKVDGGWLIPLRLLGALVVVGIPAALTRSE